MNDRTGVSIMDFKQQFGPLDRELGRGRLLQEITELRQNTDPQSANAKKGRIEHRNMHTMTDLRDVNKKVVYIEEFGEGIMAHKEIQAVDEALKTFGNVEVQTDPPLPAVDVSNESMFIDIAKTGD